MCVPLTFESRCDHTGAKVAPIDRTQMLSRERMEEVAIYREPFKPWGFSRHPHLARNQNFPRRDE
jgi:hypothetical protein